MTTNDRKYHYRAFNLLNQYMAGKTGAILNRLDGKYHSKIGLKLVTPQLSYQRAELVPFVYLCAQSRLPFLHSLHLAFFFLNKYAIPKDLSLSDMCSDVIQCHLTCT